MKKNKKRNYTLVRTVSTILVIAGLSGAITELTTPNFKEEIAFTQEDIERNIAFNDELISIYEDTTVEFINPELYDIIASQVEGELTVGKLREIKELEITQTLEEPDFRDLKYLPNLNYLSISNNTIDLEDIKYNQNLFLLNLEHCTFRNTEFIPNATDSVFFTNCFSQDNSIIVPYYTKNLHIFDSNPNNIYLKNPSELETFTLIGDGYIDLACIKDCNNLKEIKIEVCSNIRNASYLQSLQSLVKVSLDDYAAIWLDTDTLASLPLEDEDYRYILYDEITKLDEIAEIITNGEQLSDSEKIARISSYILSSLDYNYQITDEETKNSQEITDFNKNPINYALNKEEVICINYASIFQALANRLGVNSFQLFNENHTWNMAQNENGFYGYDMTYLESAAIVKLDDGELAIVEDTESQELIDIGKGSLLHFYEFDLDAIIDAEHISDSIPRKINEIVKNIGYINENSMLKIIYKNQVQIKKISTFLICELALTIIAIAVSIIERKREEKRMVKYEEK